MARKIAAIGKRFHRLRAAITVSQPNATITTRLARCKIYFVVADQDRKEMCRYYWDEGDVGGDTYDSFQMQIMDANSDDNPSAPSNITKELVGDEGGVITPVTFADEWSFVEIDKFAAEGRARASAGIVPTSKDFFHVYFHDLDTDGRSPRFKMSFRGTVPTDLKNRDLRGWLYRVGAKKKFGLDNSWIPRF
jgi:hypothetical protein